MTIDELIRLAGYTILGPGLAYLGIVAHNRGQTWWRWLAWLLSAFFFLLMVGLVLVSIGMPNPILRYANTVIVALMALTVLRQCWRCVRLWWIEWRIEREQRHLADFTLVERG